MALEFRTVVDVQPFPFLLGYNTPMLFCGSCFTENIGSIMYERKMPIIVNPFGVVYNPISVKLVIERILSSKPFEESELNFRNDLWYSYLHHTSFSSPDKEKCLELINAEQAKASDFIKRTKCMLITFGTARTYFLKQSAEPVANCHKIPAREFENRLLKVDDIVKEWSTLIDKLLKHNPDFKIVFTISPVRHWKDGAVGNQHSKSILNVAVHELIAAYPNNTFYFPAFEILMDDLRDYRYYADDMLHPSKVAIDYIWEKFKGAIIDVDSQKLINDIEKVITAVNHRPFNPNTKEYKAFVNNTLKQIERIKSFESSLNFEIEEAALNQFL
ncbi:MAG TPA: GSCFA domain protein [Bacteroidales bacterium]|nr:GSCFA domain protein [Bacteroidales bacterium]